MGVIHGKHIYGFKASELLDLDERGLVIQFSEPIKPDYWKEAQILESMIKTATKAGSPWLVTKIENGWYEGRLVMWKENKALRCSFCKDYLNARPLKLKRRITHKHVGKECAELF